MIISKKAFTIFELVIVTGIIFFLFTGASNALLKGKKKTEYDQSAYQIISFIKDARSYGSSNFIQTESGSIYKVPNGGYGVEIANYDNGLFGLVLFYNNNLNTSYDRESDEVIKEWKSDGATMYFDKMYGSGSDSQWISGTGMTQSGAFTGTIIFTNDTKSYISSGTGSNGLKNINFEFHMIYGDDRNYNKRRIKFDRLEKIIRLENFSKSKNEWSTSF